MIGNSGYDLIFSDDVVTKGSNGGDVARLRESCVLQVECEFPTPYVIGSCGDATRFAFSMERIHNATTIFHADVDACLDKVFAYVNENLKQSQTCGLPAQMFVDKINSIDAGEWSWEADELKKRFCWWDAIYLPCGPMHGDLTFCNVLCRDADVWLIDFLDGFTSSPVFDVAKMRQDSRHGWITLFDEVSTRYVDDRILETFGDLPWLRELTLLALLRIIPYAKTTQVIDWLKQEIPRAYANLDSSW